MCERGTVAGVGGVMLPALVVVVIISATCKCLRRCRVAASVTDHTQQHIDSSCSFVAVIAVVVVFVVSVIVVAFELCEYEK